MIVKINAFIAYKIFLQSALRRQLSISSFIYMSEAIVTWRYFSWLNLRLWNWKSGHLAFSWFLKSVLPKNLWIDSFLEQSTDKSFKCRCVTRNLSGQRSFLGIRALWYSSKTRKREAEQGKILSFSSKKNLKIAF